MTTTLKSCFYLKVRSNNKFLNSNRKVYVNGEVNDVELSESLWNNINGNSDENNLGELRHS